MFRLLTLATFLFSHFIFAQQIQGKVYDSEAIIAGAKLINLTTKTVTYTDERGDFKLVASVNDSLLITSLFHEQKKIRLSKEAFGDKIVFELKKIVNSLDEVLIVNEPDAKTFEPEEFNISFKNQILEDIKNNPHLYQKAPSGQMDFVAIAKLIGKLFKSKKSKVSVETFVTYEDLVKLFETDSYFTNNFLSKDLKIPAEYRSLFLEFCSAYEINSKLLPKENHFLLLDVIITCKNDFLEILESR